MLAVAGFGVVLGQIVCNTLFFVLGQPFGLSIVVRQHPEREYAQQYAGNAFQQKQPLPAVQPVSHIKMSHDPARQRAAKHARQGQADHEQRNDAAATVSREPQRQIIQYSWQEAGFRYAK
ncbi:hypothetical protein D3C71_1524870 [compost metagenome]